MQLIAITYNRCWTTAWAARMIDLRKALRVDELEPAILFDLVLTHFGHGSRDGADMVFGRAYDEPVIRFGCTKAGAVKSIVTQENWCDTDLHDLQAFIDKVLSSPDQPHVGRLYVLVDRPIKFALCVDGWFQLLPVPPGAPTDSIPWAGLNPAVLEVAYPRSVDVSLSSRRRHARVQEVLNLLAVILKCSIHAKPVSGVTWGVAVGGDMNVSQPFQEVYTFPDQPPEGEFSDASTYSPFPAGEPSDFYTDRWIVPEGQVELPIIATDAHDIVDHFNRLSDARRVQFGQAAYWFRWAMACWGQSHSASFLALVQAIEALVEVDVLDTCDTCGSRIGVSRAFRQIVEGLAKGTPRKVIDEIYRQRSKIVHAGGLLRADRYAHEFEPITIDQQSQHRELIATVRLILRNWLVTTDQPGT